MKRWTTFFLILAPLVLQGQSQELKKYYDAAIQSYKEKKYDQFYTNINAAGKLHPYHQGILYVRGKAAALTGKKDEAITCLKKAIEIYALYPLQGVEDFDAIKDSPEFAKLLDEQKEIQKPITRSDTAMVIANRTLHAEGIDYNPAENVFYIGSIHQRKIVKVNAKGEVSDFCISGYEGITSIFGIKADHKRKILWACASPVPQMENFDTLSRSAVYKFNLKDGKLIQKYEMNEKGKDGVFGDVLLSSDGEVYVSDSRNNKIFKVNEKKNQLELFYSSPEIWNLQGLAFSPNEEFLFLSDYIKGLFRLTMKSKELLFFPSPENFSLKGVDGLYFYNNGLLAIQNGVTPNRVTQYKLNRNFTAIIESTVIDRAHPAFGEPTLGVVTGHNFYYISNSQWDGYDDQHHIKPPDQLRDIVILKAPLD